MNRVATLLQGLNVLLMLGCSGTTEPDVKALPLTGKIDATLFVHRDGEIYVPTPDIHGIYLHLKGRQEYDELCYRFRTEQSLGAVVLLVRVTGVLPPDEPCVYLPYPAQSWICLGELGTGVYSLHLADNDCVYPGLLTVRGDTLAVAFPDTSRFCFTSLTWP